LVTSGKIALIDDDAPSRSALRALLTARGYTVLDLAVAEGTPQRVRTDAPDLVMVDVNASGIAAVEICGSLRHGSNLPIIVLSAGNSERDVVVALDAGADDVVAKPIRNEELLARIRAVLRRSHASLEQAPPNLTLEAVQIDFQTRRVICRPSGDTTASEKVQHLTPKEFELLFYLASRPGQVIPHRKLLQAVWGPNYGGQVDCLRVFINQLRKKIEPDPGNPRFIVTEPWVGYRFSPPLNTSAQAQAAPPGNGDGDLLQKAS
jgi:two-component system, OmpR family, KDP operon response regulator KdpE